jgi:hypothetical protein
MRKTKPLDFGTSDHSETLATRNCQLVRTTAQRCAESTCASPDIRAREPE